MDFIIWKLPKIQERGGEDMATKIPYNSRLSLIFQMGTDPDSGAPVLKTKSFSNVKHDATDDDVYAVATGLANLQKHPLYEVQRTDRGKLAE